MSTEQAPDADARRELAARISRALAIAPDSMHDGEHRKVWAIDQMVRALTGCPVVTKTALDYRGQPYEYEGQGESEEYLQFTAELGDWDEGIAP